MGQVNHIQPKNEGKNLTTDVAAAAEVATTTPAVAKQHFKWRQMMAGGL